MMTFFLNNKNNLLVLLLLGKGENNKIMDPKVVSYLHSNSAGPTNPRVQRWANNPHSLSHHDHHTLTGGSRSTHSVPYSQTHIVSQITRSLSPSSLAKKTCERLSTGWSGLADRCLAVAIAVAVHVWAAGGAGQARSNTPS